MALIFVRPRSARTPASLVHSKFLRHHKAASAALRAPCVQLVRHIVLDPSVCSVYQSGVNTQAGDDKNSPKWPMDVAPRGFVRHLATRSRDASKIHFVLVRNLQVCFGLPSAEEIAKTPRMHGFADGASYHWTAPQAGNTLIDSRAASVIHPVVVDDQSTHLSRRDSKVPWVNQKDQLRSVRLWSSDPFWEFGPRNARQPACA